jgi:hypothetical protein
MGTRTDCEIASFREAAGITPETGEEEAIKLLQAAGVKPAPGKKKWLLKRIIEGGDFAIACLKSELSGERDGDGLWHGSDPVSASIEDLIRVCQEWLDWENQVRNAQRILKENESEEAYNESEKAYNDNIPYFGGCPTCGKNDGYRNAGRTHVFFCREHRCSWIVGANLFSDWKDESEEEQSRKYREIEDFARVEPLWPDTAHVVFSPAGN